jgi:hypothetical protein
MYMATFAVLDSGYEEYYLLRYDIMTCVVEETDVSVLSVVCEDESVVSFAA